MTMDRTLKIHGGLIGTRSVLSRAERIARLIDEGKFDPAVNSPLGLPKVRVRHSKAGTKTKKAAEEAPAVAAEAATAEGAAAAKAAPSAEGPKAAAAKGAAPKAATPKAATPKAAAPKGEAKPAAKGQEKKK